MASTTALPLPTSIEQGKVPPTSSAGCCYKACAGHFICRLLLLRGLCRPLRLLAVYCKACAGWIVCRLFYCKACAGRIICRLFTARPVPVGSSAGCLLQGLYWSDHLPAVLLQGLCRSASQTALFCHAMPCLPAFAITPCLLPLLFIFPVHYHVRQDHRASCRDCPVGSRNTGLHWRPVHCLCSLRSFQRGRPRTACE